MADHRSGDERGARVLSRPAEPDTPTVDDWWPPTGPAPTGPRPYPTWADLHTHDRWGDPATCPTCTPNPRPIERPF